MFHSATLRLTTLYVAILIAICLFFSVNLYHLSDSELNTGLGRQVMYFERNPQFQNFLGDDYLSARQNQLSESRHHLIVELIEIDLIIISLGGIGSYFLAKRTLKPIADAHDAQVRFTGDASHELRTPIAAMQAEIEVALRDKKLSQAEATALLKSNLEELAKLSGLANGLLQLTRPETDRPTQPVNLKTVIAEAISRVSKAAAEKRLTITSDLAGELTVSGDQPSLVMLLATLLDNAIKYSDAKTTVTIEASQTSPKEVTIKVRDEGSGIKAADLPHIFDRFYRADSGRSKTKVDGYGLGLSIAKNIAGRHGGSISAESTLGHGSIFTVKLPLAKD